MPIKHWHLAGAVLFGLFRPSIPQAFSVRSSGREARRLDLYDQPIIVLAKKRDARRISFRAGCSVRHNAAMEDRCDRHRWPFDPVSIGHPLGSAPERREHEDHEKHSPSIHSRDSHTPGTPSPLPREPPRGDPDVAEDTGAGPRRWPLRDPPTLLRFPWRHLRRHFVHAVCCHRSVHRAHTRTHAAGIEHGIVDRAR